MTILFDEVLIALGYYAEQGQNGVPDRGTEERVSQKSAEVHPCQSCGDGDELADAGDESAHKRGHFAVLVEIGLSALNLLGTEKQHVPQAGVGELVDNRPAEPHGERVVDDGTKDSAFTVAKNKGAEAKEICEKFADNVGAGGVDYEDDIAKVSIVGAGMESHAGVASKMFEALYDKQINIRMISTSEIKVSVIIDKDDADSAVSAIHEKFFPKEK